MYQIRTTYDREKPGGQEEVKGYDREECMINNSRFKLFYGIREPESMGRAVNL